MQKRYLCLGVLCFASALPSKNSMAAEITYDYSGLDFTSVSGAFTKSDRLTGFVTFASVPLPGQTVGKSDVAAFSFNDGVRTLSSADGDSEFFNDDFFTFNSTLQITDFQFSAVPGDASDNSSFIESTPTEDFTRLEVTNADSGSNSGGGSFSIVPEPTSLSLLGLTGIGLLKRRRP